MGRVGDGMPDGVFHATSEKPLLQPNGLPSAEAFLLWTSLKDQPVHQDDEVILRFAKEIAIKFIELGRISPDTFGEHFRRIFWSLKSTVVDARMPELGEKIEAEGEAEEGVGTT